MIMPKTFTTHVNDQNKFSAILQFYPRVYIEDANLILLLLKLFTSIKLYPLSAPIMKQSKSFNLFLEIRESPGKMQEISYECLFILKYSI